MITTKLRNYAFLILSAAVFVFLMGGASAGAAGDLLPNLVPLKASELRIENTFDGKRLLRFTTTSWNNGQGPLELVAGGVEGSGPDQRQRVYQRIWSSDGTSRDVLAGSVAYHSDHNHFHFDDYADYILQPANAPGASQRTGSKTTFCVMDTTRVDTKLPGATKRATYTTCGAQLQGMSVGWGDSYRYYLDGQSIDITGLPDGDYVLRIIVDPKNKIVEANDSDNLSELSIRLVNGGVQVLEAKPRGRP